jgi:hypothetical protein
MSVLKQLLTIIEENKMKVRFDTNTKNLEAALDAYRQLAKLTNDMTLSVSSYGQTVYNLYGDITTNNIDTLEKYCTEGWDEDSSNL